MSVSNRWDKINPQIDWNMSRISDAIPTFSYKVATPDGDMFVHIMEEIPGKPTGIALNIGKVGHSVFAWASAVASLATVMLQSGISIHKVLEQVSGLTTERRTHQRNGVYIRSGPEGVAYAIMLHIRKQSEEREKEYNDDERPARFRNYE